MTDPSESVAHRDEEAPVDERPTTLQGDVPCARCGGPFNLIWVTDNVVWNTVVRRHPNPPWGDRDPILCQWCFVAVTEEVGIHPVRWRLTPEWDTDEGPCPFAQVIGLCPVCDRLHEGRAS